MLNVSNPADSRKKQHYVHFPVTYFPPENNKRPYVQCDSYIFRLLIFHRKTIKGLTFSVTAFVHIFHSVVSFM